MNSAAIFLVVLILGIVLVAIGVVLGSYRPLSLAGGASRRCLEQLRARTDHLRQVIAEATAEMSDHHNHLRHCESVLRQAAEELPPHLLEIIAELLTANSRLQERLSRAEQRLAEQTLLLESQQADSRTDPLTQLANRRAFEETLTGIEGGASNGEPVRGVVLLIDVDHFKRLNDRWGHPTGDAALRRVADILRRAAGRAGLLARIGGEEFALVLPKMALTDAAALADRLRAAVAADHWTIGDQTIRLSVSAGLAEWEHGHDIRQCFKRADDALYAAKRNGRNTVFYHDGRQLLRWETDTVDEAAWHELCGAVRRRLAELIDER